MSEPLIWAKSLSIERDGTRLLHNINLQVGAGEIVTIIGPNGAGKSTLVKALLGLMPASDGLVGRQPGLKIGYAPQKVSIPQTLPLTVERFLRTLSVKPSIEASKQALSEVGALHLLQESVHHLSGGQWQRVLLARALLGRPALLVLDEPAQGLDISGQTQLYSTLATIRDRHHCGVLLVSHELHIVMAATDTVVCLNQHICCQGKPERVSKDPAFLNLFGQEAAGGLALYTHHHTHQHGLDGDIVE